MIRLIVVYFLSDKYMADTFSPLFYHVKTKKFFPCLVFCVQLVETETIILCATLTQVQKECLSRLQLILCLECKYSTIENNQGSNHFFNLKIFFMNPSWLRCFTLHMKSKNHQCSVNSGISFFPRCLLTRESVLRGSSARKANEHRTEKLSPEIALH